MLKTILIGALAAIVIVAVGMSAYNTMAGSSTQQEAQPDQSIVGQANSPSQLVSVPEQVQPTVSPVEDEDPTSAVIPALPDAQTVQTPNEPAVQQVAGPARGGQRGGNGGGNGNGNRWQGSNSNGSTDAVGSPGTQNGLTEWLTLHGTVSDYASPSFILLSDDGQAIAVQLGNQSYVASLGLILNDGDTVTVTGYKDSSGSLAVGQITSDANGRSYTLRDDLGRPLWGGGPNR